MRLFQASVSKPIDRNKLEKQVNINTSNPQRMNSIRKMANLTPRGFVYFFAPKKVFLRFLIIRYASVDLDVFVGPAGS